MTKKELVEKVKSLLPTAPQLAIEFACELTLQSICTYCNLTEAPDGLLCTAALMARGLYSSTQLANEELQPAVKGVSRMDASFSFASAAEQMAQMAASGDFLTNYQAQLNAYRKMR